MNVKQAIANLQTLINTGINAGRIFGDSKAVIEVQNSLNHLGGLAIQQESQSQQKKSEDGNPG